ncbi:MAG: histidinol-phosphatase [Firmicutes bacterium]|nr:histidinol-phosphatase [Bacillota bacterium]
MISCDYHMHTTWCDGSASAEDMVRAAIARGMTEIGFSGHSHTAFDESYCMSPAETENYRQELLALRKKYDGQISIRIGLEMDYYSDADPAGFDYLIGSVHYVRALAGTCSARPDPAGVLRDGNRVYVPVDETPQLQREAVERYFGRDWIAFAECYFDTVGGAAEKTGCDIIGHFDLITKFNEGGVLFDEEDPRYRAAWMKAADRALASGALFEINTGAMAKGYRSAPYPAAPIREYIRSRGGRFILSSDSHRTDSLCHAFDQFEEEAAVTRLPLKQW